ncbi:MAG: hypothetical protein MZW92_70690 [Comamonadaceae bacterium]|nr:hypothetical protein [Comamonadaceae bacterium]
MPAGDARVTRTMTLPTATSPWPRSNCCSRHCRRLFAPWVQRTRPARARGASPAR